MMSDILFDRQGGIATVTFNRPDKKNALTHDMVRQLIAWVEGLEYDDGLQVVLFRANGADFCSGADLGEKAGEMLKESPEVRSAGTRKNIKELSMALFLALDRIRVPVVVSVRGHAAGGGAQLVLAADLVVASETARISLPQVKIGMVTDNGQSYFLPRKVGMGHAAKIMLLGDAVGAVDAERFGLVNWVTADVELEGKTEEIVNRLARGPRQATLETKALLRSSLHLTYVEQFEAERNACGRCVADPDFVEALTAFNEKRKPDFRRGK